MSDRGMGLLKRAKNPRRKSLVMDLLLRSGAMTPRALSHEISRLAGRPVLVVDPAALSYAPPPTGDRPAFTPEQLKKRGAELAEAARTTFPYAQKSWQGWKWDYSAAVTAAAYQAISTSETPARDLRAPLAPRLAGDFWNKVAIIWLPDSRRSIAEEWKHMGCAAAGIEFTPQTFSLRHYITAHELAHVLQRDVDAEPLDIGRWNYDRFRKAWPKERDADLSAFTEMKKAANDLATPPALRRDLRETCVAVLNMRALMGFLGAAADYMNAPALDADLRGRPAPGAEKCLIANYELRWRVAEKLAGNGNPGSSQDLQEKLGLWFEGKIKDNAMPWAFAWFKNDRHVERTIPALREIVTAGEIADPVALRNAQLVIRAAHYFRPSLRPESAAPGPSAAPAALAAARPEPTASSGSSARARGPLVPV